MTSVGLFCHSLAIPTALLNFAEVAIIASYLWKGALTILSGPMTSQVNRCRIHIMILKAVGDVVFNTKPSAHKTTDHFPTLGTVKTKVFSSSF